MPSFFARSFAPFCAAVIAVLVATAHAVRAQAAPAPPVIRHEIVRGVVTIAGAAGAAGAGPATPVPGAAITITRGPDRVSKSVASAADGSYVMDWPDGTGDYLVHVAAVGYETFRKRVTRGIGPDTVFVVDVALRPAAGAQVLAPVVTTARKQKPDRTPAFGAEVGASEQLSGGLNGKLPPDVAGDLAAIAGTLPGVLPTGGGISVLGLTPDQNSTTLNGIAFAGADIPRDANTRVRVSSSTYDPSRGWFSGANTNVELALGNVFTSRRSHVTLDAPALQYTDPVSARLGQRFAGGQLSYGADGEAIQDKWYYNIGIQGGRRAADVASLITADNDLLEHAGVAADSASRLLSLLKAAGIPTSVAGVPTMAVTDNVSFIGRFDHKPYDPETLAAANSTWGLTTYAKLARTGALTAGPLATPAHGGESSQAIGSLQGEYASYFGSDYLADVRSSVSLTQNRTSPYLDLPDARVRVESDFPDVDAGFASLQFGGNSALSGDSKMWNWETASDVQFFARNSPRHKIKLSGDVRVDGYSQTLTSNTLGTFSYNSLGDVAANTPVAFTRTLNSPEREGAEWNAFLAAGDLWRLSQSWQLLYGARVEGNAFTNAPAFNPAIDQEFGARTDYAPTSLHVSPRIGFNYNRTGQTRNSVIANPLGRFTGTTPGVLRGGIGEFRGLTPPNLLSSALVSTGLPGSQERLSCIGASVPTPDWSAYEAGTSSIPSSCAGGAPSLSDAAPAVVLFDPSWRMARSWRSNLAWSSVFDNFNYTIEGLYSLNLNQPGSYDLNFMNAPRFTLADERRPVFVLPSDIVPATGLVSPTDARVGPAFGHVTSVRGDGRSVSRQATFTLSPNLVGTGFSSFYVAGGYTLSSIRALERGFDATTFGSPTDRAWMRGDLDARHQLILQGGYASRGFTLTAFGRLQSGLPFTPVVGGDVNGDGLANDRAFIPDPAHTRDSSVARDLRALVASSPAAIRDCLTKQFGRAADAESCEGPWTATLNTRLGYVGGGQHLSRRVDIGLNLANPLGGLDQLLHGTNGLRGWGTAPAPDPVLLNVRGYDPTAQSFLYSVNPRFGNTRPSATTLRAPFRVTLDVSIDLGRKIEEQQVDRWLQPGRAGHSGVKADVQDLKRRYDRNVPDLYAQVLQQSDSLLLSRDQVDALQKVRAAYRARMDSVWTTLATYLANLPDQYNPHDAYTHAEDAIDGAWELTRLDLRRTLPTILNPVQIQLLPSIVRLIYNANEPLHIRVFIAGG